MKNKLTKYGFLLWAAIIIMATTFVACEKEEDSAVSLDAFGPTPVLRGETIRFMGNNLDKVTTVVFPDNMEVAPAVVSSSEITAVIPLEAVNGFITLRYPGGSLITKSRITYADAIVFTAVSGENDPVRAGNVITITGDNLTGVTQVVFSVDVTVESRDFLTQSRYEITLTLPDNAQTGDVYLLAGATESSHINLNVDGPAITSLTATPLKPGRDTLHITGANLDLAVSVIFSGGITVDAVPVSATEIKAAVPDSALNGTVTVVSIAGLEYASADNIVLVAPSDLTHTPVDRYKAGSEIVISGDDLDLVTGVIFPGDVNAEFTYNDAAGNITVAIPNTATDGPITLRCVAGDVPAPDVMLVKPAITSIMPATIQAGDPITIAGADLDLVTGITVGGKDGSLTSQSETEIQAATPMDASIAGTGVEVALTLANGTFVTATIDVTFPAYCFILEFPAPDVEIKAGELLQVIIENSDKLTGVEVNGSATQYILQGTALYILIPGNAGGQTSLKLISDNGDAEYTIDVVGTGPVETVIFNEIHDFVDWNSAEIRLYKEDFANVPVGSKLKFYFTVNGTGQMNMSDANWVKLDFPDDPYWDGQWQQLTFNNASLTSHEIVLTQDVLSKIMTADDGWSTTAIVIKGNLLIVSKISLITGGDH